MLIEIEIEDMSEEEVSRLKDLLQCVSVQSEVNDIAQQAIEKYEKSQELWKNYFDF